MINKGSQSLPQKDAKNFRQLAKFHDAKNYKKGMKEAEKLLQAHPDHAQTLSMKALFQLGLGDENKALQTSKQGLMKSKMKSMFCWHTLGTIYKFKKDYYEASKSYQNAVKFEPDNVQLLREIAAMNIQIRDHSSHVTLRLNILKLKPNMIQNWTAFTLANHLKGDYKELFKALKSLDNLLKTTGEVKPIQMSHYYLYRIVAFRDAQNYETMYEELNQNKNLIKDQVSWYELSIECCLKLGKKQQAIKYIETLVKQFPENVEYMQQYKIVHSIQSYRQLYATISKEYKSKIAKILEISHIDQEKQFKLEFATLIKRYYQKNLVSLFAEIQVIYESTKVKKQWIQSVLEEFNKTLKDGAYPDGQKVKSPSEYLWSMYILAQHYSLEFNDLQKALDFINQAISHTNTVSEIYIVKADILYKMHNNIEALVTVNEARKTDLADRYMNNICVKYLMKCLKPILGEQMLRTFMRDDANVYELQNQWYIIEAGKSYLKQRNFEAGLKHMHFIYKQFLEMQASEFDFHFYCLRKWTLKEYTELIKFNDNIYANKKYMQAAAYAIRYLREYEDYVKQEQSKAKIKQEQTVAEKKTSNKKNKKKKNKQPEVEQLSPIESFRKKIDYYGKQYALTIKKNPLEQALLWAKNVASAKFQDKHNLKENKLYGNANLEAILIFIQFDKPLLVLRCFKKLLRTRFDQFQIEITTIRVLAYFEKYLSRQDANQISKEVLKEFLSESFAGKTSKSCHEEVQKLWKNDAHFLADIKIKESHFAVDQSNDRQAYISLYKSQLSSCLQKDMNGSNIQLILYLTHKLEYYGQFDKEIKTKLNQLLQKKTSYFTNWQNQIEKLPSSTWTMWWLSEYDIQKQQMEDTILSGSDTKQKQIQLDQTK